MTNTDIIKQCVYTYLCMKIYNYNITFKMKYWFHSVKIICLNNVTLFCGKTDVLFTLERFFVVVYLVLHYIVIV